MDRETAYNYIRSKFIELQETRKLIKKHNLKIKYGFLSKEESNTVKETIERFLSERNYTMADLQKHLVEEEEFPFHDLLYECTQACEFRTFKSIHTHVAYTYNPFIHTTWNVEEELQLLDLVSQKGFIWKEISYHLSKYKDLCRNRYLWLKGERAKHLGKHKIEQLLSAGLPATGEEWTALCEQLKMSKNYILRAIEKYLNGKELEKPREKTKEILLCLLILRNNHFCKFDINIDSIMSYLNSDTTSFNLYERIDGSKTPFLSVRGKKVRVVNEINQRQAVDENNDCTDITTMKSNDGEEIEAEFDSLLGSIKNSINSGNKEQARFLNVFLEFFSSCQDYDMEVVLNKEDVFWQNVTREMVLDKAAAIAKFNTIKQQYNWRTYKDVYDTVIKIAYDHVMLRIKDDLLSKNLKGTAKAESRANVAREDQKPANLNFGAEVQLNLF